MPEFTWLNLIFTIWIAVSVILIIRAIYKYHKAIKILKKTVIEPKPELQAQLDAVAKQCKIKSMVKLRISDSISSPVTYGFIKPVVLFQTKLLRMKSLILLRRMNVVISKTKIYG